MYDWFERWTKVSTSWQKKNGRSVYVYNVGSKSDFLYCSLKIRERNWREKKDLTYRRHITWVALCHIDQPLLVKRCTKEDIKSYWMEIKNANFPSCVSLLFEPCVPHLKTFTTIYIYYYLRRVYAQHE